MAMTIKFALLTALLYYPAAGARLAAQQQETVAVSASTQPAVESPSTDRDPPLMRKLRELKNRMREEFRKKHEPTPEEARRFRTKAVMLSIKYHNIKNKRSKIPLINSEDFAIHSLIYAQPQIAAQIFACELEICKSTDAYNYKAQAEAIRGDKAQAEADWTNAIKIAPETEPLRHRGYLYFTQRRYDQAIADFTRAIKDRGIAPLYHSRAMAYYQKDDYSGAANDLEQFFKLNTDKEYSRSVSVSRLCYGLRKRGFIVEGCADPENGGEKK